MCKCQRALNSPILVNRRRPAPRSAWVPLEQAICAAVAWDMDLTFPQLCDIAIGNETIMRRLYARCQTIDWVRAVIGKKGIVETYSKYKSVMREDLRSDIAAFYPEALKEA